MEAFPAKSVWMNYSPMTTSISSADPANAATWLVSYWPKKVLPKSPM